MRPPSPRKKYKPSARKATGRPSQRDSRNLMLVDCPRCGGGASRCGLCRDSGGKVLVSR